MGYSATSVGQEITWTPTLTGFSADPAGIIARYTLNGQFCTAVVSMPNNGTSNATTFTITLPFTSKYAMYGIGEGVDNGAAATNMGVSLTANSNIATLSKNAMTGGGWTGSGNKRGYFTITYIVA